MNTKTRLFTIGLISFSLARCMPDMPSGDGGDAGRIGDGAADGAAVSPPPPSMGMGNRCALSADCPAGTFCDLGECIQQCNTRDPCTGQFTCTPRGRCADPDAGVATNDPPVVVPSGRLSVLPERVALDPTQTTVELTLRGSGAVRYRVETGGDWLSIATPRGEFNDTTRLTLNVDATRVPRDGSIANVSVHSTQGTVIVPVSASTAMTGRYRGTIQVSGVRVGGGAMPVTFPVALGTTRVGFDLFQDRSTVQARVVPVDSPMWPAASAEAAAAGAGTITMDAMGERLTVRLTQRIEAAQLTPGVVMRQPVFGSRALGRELELNLRINRRGELTGDSIERIHGLTSTPVEIVGTVALRLAAGSTVASFAAPSPPTMPAGPARARGASAYCEGEFTDSYFECTSPSATQARRQQCITSLLSSAFPLHRFYQNDESTSSAFRLPDSIPMGMTPASPYAVWTQNCRNDFAGNIYSDRDARSRLCVNSMLLSCANYAASGLFRETDPERTQAAHDTARAWGETFAMLGNEAMVAGWRTAVLADATNQRIKTDFTAARDAYEAGLVRFFRPELFEELRGALPAVVNGSAFYAVPVGSRPNDRIALRRLADLVGGTMRATNEVVRLESVVPGTDRSTLQQRFQKDALLLWLESALTADLDARWRTSPTSDSVGEVQQLAAVLTSLDSTIGALAPEMTPLGFPISFVRLLPAEPGNFANNYANAMMKVTEATSDEASARAATREFDAAQDRVQTALVEASSSFRSAITGLCGANALTGSTFTFGQCGSMTGSVRARRADVDRALLELSRAANEYDVYEQRVRLQEEVMVRRFRIRNDQLEFQDRTNNMLINLEGGRVAARTAQALASSLVGALGNPALWAAPWAAAGYVGVMTATTLIDNTLGLEQMRLQQMQGMVSARADLALDQLEQQRAYRELLLQRQQVVVGITRAQLDVGAALAAYQTELEQVARAVSAFDEARSFATRPFANDPAFRIERDLSIRRARSSYDSAREALYFAIRALEYETNTELPSLRDALYAAPNATSLESVRRCLNDANVSWQSTARSANEYTREVSVRRDILGIVSPRMDPDTGETISPAEQFRRRLFAQPVAVGTSVWPAIRFGTTLRSEDPVFNSLVCNARIASVEAQLVGDFLGDNQAVVRAFLEGDNILRACNSRIDAMNAMDQVDSVRTWRFRLDGSGESAVIQAGINSFGTTMPNTSFRSFAVAQSSWLLAIPDGRTAPENADLDPRKVDDIVLRIRYTGLPLGGAGAMFGPVCR